MSISSFALQFSNVNFAAVSNSSFDLFITEGAPNPRTRMPGFAAISDAEVAVLRGQGRQVVGYVNVAVTDDTRYYWQGNWTADGKDTSAPTANAPSWLQGAIPVFFDSVPGQDALLVNFQDSEWQKIVIDQAVELVRRGYSGVFLDDVGRYFDGPSGPGQISARATAMAEFVALIDAKIRELNPDAYLVVNANPYLTTDVTGDARGSAAAASYLAAVDAHLLENQSAAAIDYAASVTLVGRARLILESDGTPAFSVADSWARGILYTSPTPAYNTLSLVAHYATEGNDVIRGGDGPNALSGLGGNDVLIGGRGPDVLDGGAGFDEARYSSARKTYRVSVAQEAGVPATRIALGPEGGTDTLRNVEQARFTDGVLSFDPAGNAAKVMRMYDATLQRAPDSPGYEFWLGQLDSGMSLSAMAASFATTTEFVSRYGQLNNQQFIEQLYIAALGRAGSSNEVQFWTGYLNAGNSRGEVLREFSETGEHVTRTSGQLAQGLWIADPNARVAARMYDAALDRLPDSGGLAVWTSALNSGTTVIQMAGAFAASQEFQARFGNLSNQQFIEQLYVFALNRPGDSAGVQFWTNQLSSGQSRAFVLAEFSETAEHVTSTAPLWYNGITVVDGVSQSASAATEVAPGAGAATGFDLDTLFPAPVESLDGLEAEWAAALAAISDSRDAKASDTMVPAGGAGSAGGDLFSNITQVNAGNFAANVMLFSNTGPDYVASELIV